MTREKNRRKSLLQLILLIAIIILVNVVATGFYYRIDLTQEKRYSISEPTKELLKNQEDIISVQIFLAGNLTPNLKRLQTATTELLDQFGNFADDNIQYSVFDPFSIPDENNQMKYIAGLEKKGVYSIQFLESTTDESSMKYVFPFATLSYHDQELSIPLIDRGSMPLPLTPDSDPSVSISLLEYTFTKAIRELTQTEKPYISFISGHGELNKFELNDVAGALNELYNVTIIDAEDDSTFEIPLECKAIVVAKPITAFSVKAKYVIDQYIMKGGNVIWLIDPVIADFDSLYTGQGQFIATDYELNLTDMFVQYGARINSDIIQDKQCTNINVPVANGTNFVQRPWPYNPVLNNYNQSNPISKNIDAVEGKFVSSVDTINVAGIKKTILLSTSSQSRALKTPVRVNFNIVNEKYAPTDAQYNKPNMPVAVLLEGKFSSAFKSLKPTAKQLHGMGFGYQNGGFIEYGVEAKQIMIGDGDLIKNNVDKTGKPDVLGRNYIEQYDFANREFFMSCVEYMADKSGLAETHGKEVKLRPLDAQKTGENRIQWQLINIIAPLILLYIFSGIYLFIRNRKYAS